MQEKYHRKSKKQHDKYKEQLEKKDAKPLLK